jgi:hypothetical protein
MSDHDDLIEIKTKLDILIKHFDNHLAHHFRYSLLAWATALSAIAALVVTLCKAF